MLLQHYYLSSKHQYTSFDERNIKNDRLKNNQDNGATNPPVAIVIDNRDNDESDSDYHQWSNELERKPVFIL